MSTAVWLSSAVENTSVRRAGIVVLRSITFVMTPPIVSRPERQRRDVEQHDVLDLALEHARLQRGADGHDLVRVDGHVRVLAAGQLADELLDRRDPRRAADEDHLVDVVGGHLGVRQRLLDGPARALDQVGAQLLELGAA